MGEGNGGRRDKNRNIVKFCLTYLLCQCTIKVGTVMRDLPFESHNCDTTTHINNVHDDMRAMRLPMF